MQETRRNQQVAIVEGTIDESPRQTRQQKELLSIREEIRHVLLIFMGAGFSLSLVIGLVAGLIGAWGSYTETWTLALKWGVPIAAGAAFIYACVRGYMWYDRQKEQIQASRDERQRMNDTANADNALKLAQAEEIRARAKQLYFTLPVDERGNTLYHNPYTSTLTPFTMNYQEHPNLSSMHYSIRQERDGLSEGGLLGAGQSEGVQPLPKIEAFYDAIKFNSLTTGLGAQLGSGELVLAPIRKSTHFKLIGGSGQGKSCVAAGILNIATTTNDADHLKIGLLDLEYNTSRLFENLPHIAEIGPKRQRLVGRNAEEVAQKLKLLLWELNRRAQLGEEYCTLHEAIILVYVEEMLALKYEVVDKQLNKEMLAAINILGVRGRKYGIFFLACMQTDYSDTKTREAMAQFRTRAGFAIDPDTARASGFFNTDLINENFRAGRQGQYVLEKPAFSGIVLAPDYDVAIKLEALTVTKQSTTGATSHQPYKLIGGGQDKPYEVDTTTPEVAPVVATTSDLTPQEWRIIEKWRGGMGLRAIIASEFTTSDGKPLQGGDAFTQKAKEIQTLVGRFLPAKEA